MDSFKHTYYSSSHTSVYLYMLEYRNRWLHTIHHRHAREKYLKDCKANIEIKVLEWKCMWPLAVFSFSRFTVRKPTSLILGRPRWRLHESPHPKQVDNRLGCPTLNAACVGTGRSTGLHCIQCREGGGNILGYLAFWDFNLLTLYRAPAILGSALVILQAEIQAARVRVRAGG